jgi:hypothetical protein
MTLFQEDNTVSNNKLIFPVALKICKYGALNKNQHCYLTTNFRDVVNLHCHLSTNIRDIINQHCHLSTDIHDVINLHCHRIYYAFIGNPGSLSVDQEIMAFNMLDQNKDGYIDMDELTNDLHKIMPGGTMTAEELMEEA